MIYLDNAATTGRKPTTVVQAVKYALEHNSANPGRGGHAPSINAASVVYKTREKLSAFFGSDGPETVVFTQNCTHSINCVLKGILKKGDHCVISSLEHNAVIRPLTKTGISYTVAEVDLKDDGKTIENFRKAIKPNTRLVFCTGASNVLGKILPIEIIGRLCREKGVLFGVDAAQTAGVIPIDMKKQNIDFLCIAPHKGLYAPMGVGVLIARKNLPNTIIEGGTGTNSIDAFQPAQLPERLESGTVNLPAIAGISAGIDYVKSIGLENIYKGEFRLVKRLYEALKREEEVQLYTENFEYGSFVPLILFNIKGMDSSTASSVLSDNGIAVRGGLHCAPSAHRQIGTLNEGGIRVAVATFNRERDIDILIRTVKEKLIKK